MDEQQLVDMLRFMESHLQPDVAEIKSWSFKNGEWDVHMSFHTKNPSKRSLCVGDLGPTDKIMMWKGDDLSAEEGGSHWVIFMDLEDEMKSATLYLHLHNMRLTVL